MEEGTAFISLLMIAKKFRHDGIGKATIEKLETYLKKKYKTKILKSFIDDRVNKKCMVLNKFDEISKRINFIGEIGEECIYELLIDIIRKTNRYHNPYISIYNIYWLKGLLVVYSISQIIYGGF